jgi:hypothetical protein
MAISLLDYQNQTQNPMRRGLVALITNEPVFLRRLNFIPVDDFQYRYNRQTTLGGIAFRGLNASYTPDQGVVNPLIESLSIMGGQVNTDRQLVNKQGDVARSNAIAAKIKKAGLFFDRYVLQGDPAVDPLQFYGLNSRLTGNQLIIGGTNGATLTLAMVDQLIDAVVGETKDKILCMNKAMRRKISALVLGAAGGALPTNVGTQLREYNGVPIEVIDEDGDETPILPFTETQGSSNVTTSLYCIRLGGSIDGEYTQGLVGGTNGNPNIEHVPVGLLGTFYADIVEANLGLAMFHPRAAARLKGITNT